MKPVFISFIYLAAHYNITIITQLQLLVLCLRHSIGATWYSRDIHINAMANQTPWHHNTITPWHLHFGSRAEATYCSLIPPCVTACICCISNPLSPPLAELCAANSESIVPGAERLIGNMRLAQSPPLTLQIPLQAAHTHFYFYSIVFPSVFQSTISNQKPSPNWRRCLYCSLTAEICSGSYFSRIFSHIYIRTHSRPGWCHNDP